MNMVDKSTIDRIESIIKQVGIPAGIATSIRESIDKHYYNGVDSIEKIINQNIVNVQPEAIKFLKEYNFDLIKDMNSELSNNLRKTLIRGIIEGKNPSTLKQEIKKMFDTTIARAQTIARTETTRAYGVGQYVAAKNSPVKLMKYIVTVPDNRRSALCDRLGRKYPKSNAIPVDKKFKDDKTGESWLTIPFHPNERSKVIYFPVEEKTN